MQTQPQALERPRYGPPATPVGDAGDIQLIGLARTFGRDQEIFGEGDAAELVYRVLTGAVRSFRVLADGRRQIEEFYLPGDVFGVEFGAERRACAEALGPTSVVVARRTSITSDTAQGQNLWRHAMKDLRRSQDHVLTLGRRSATERVASFL